ncbi:MAG: FecR domain-containing protein, partial [Planctomycetota bacterium]
MHKKDNIKVDDMLYLLAEGVLGDEGVGYINGWLASGPEAVKYYCQFINDYVAIKHEVNSIIEMDNSLFGVSDEFDLELWSALADAEKIAPAVEIPKEQPQRELIQKVVYPPREKRKISKFNLFTLITSAAAILFVVLFLKFAPAKQYSVEVATLADQMNVQWGQSHPALASGSRLWTNESPYVLEKGIVKILYDEGVEVLIESPAKFEIERSGVYLEYGRLFSRVSESGLGFSVETQNSRFVDLGTEFGVKAEIDGSSELHVIKGKVQLFAGSKNNDKISQVLQEDVAVRFDAKSGQLKSVPIQKVAFVRDVSSQDGSVWRGQMEIDLADIVGGGNGFGTGRWGVSVNPDTGKMQDGFVCRNGVPVRGSGNYVAMETPEGVDGVFVPDGGQGTVVVSSAGHVFQECPDTSGKFCWDIYNGNAG